MNDALIGAMLDHARREAPREACGFVVDPGSSAPVVLRCENAAHDPESHFLIRPRDFARAEDEGAILAVWHSHIGAPHPSDADRAQCERHRLPFIIVSATHGSWTRIEPTGATAPLEGRAWVAGAQDCADLVRDYYARELGIELPNPHRDDHWWMKGQDLIASLHATVGFVWVPAAAMRANDVLVFQREAEVPHHVAVYLGDGLMLHHPYGKLSRRAPYDEHWRRSTFGVLRHRSLLRPEDAYRE